MPKTKVIARHVTLEVSRQYHKQKIQNTKLQKEVIARPKGLQKPSTTINENTPHVKDEGDCSPRHARGIKTIS